MVDSLVFKPHHHLQGDNSHRMIYICEEAGLKLHEVTPVTNGFKGIPCEVKEFGDPYYEVHKIKRFEPKDRVMYKGEKGTVCRTGTHYVFVLYDNSGDTPRATNPNDLVKI